MAKKGFLITLGAIVVIYVAVALYMTEHFFPQTTINGVDVSFMSEDAACAALTASLNNYKISVEDPRFEAETIDVRDIGVKVKSFAEIRDKIDTQNPSLWFESIYQPFEYEIEGMFETDQALLRQAVGTLECVNTGKGNKPINAYVAYDLDAGEFTIKPERYGDYIDADFLTDALMKSIGKRATTHNVPEMGGFALPSITKDDEKLATERDSLNEYLDAAISYTLGAKSFTLDKDVYHDWLYVRDDGVVDISEMKLRNFVENMSATYDTYGTERRITTSYGNVVTLKSKDYGWKIDQLSEMEKLSNDILDHHVVTRDFVYEKEAVSHDNVDLGNSYVEINLTRQHLFLYIDGVRTLDTDVVTGNLRTGCKTPGGIFKINFMNRDRYLTGDTYRTFVHYWMPFNKGIGLHDATWRSQFGGEIYKTSGSHGCVNMPLEMAKAVYESVEPGFMVICYWEDEN